MFNVIMLFALIILYRITAYIILWIKGCRESIKISNCMAKRKKLRIDYSDLIEFLPKDSFIIVKM